MKKAAFTALLIALAVSVGCKSSSAPSASKSGDAFEQKLQELAGGGAKNCGRIKTQSADELKPAGECAMDAAQSKKPFYVAYELPGMIVGLAGNSEGKLFSVQTETGQTSAEVKSQPCQAEIRLAQSGRVTCFGQGSMGASPHGGMGMPPAGEASPHGGMSMPPSGTPNPHEGGKPATRKE